MKKPVLVLCLILLVQVAARAQSPVTIQVQDKPIAKPNSPDFAGLSFETSTMQYSTAEHPAENTGGFTGYLWSPGNSQLLTLLRNLQIRSLRIGGGTVDESDNPNRKTYTPEHKDIDTLFQFAKKAHVKIIYSVRLKNGNPQDDAEAVKYVWDHYRPYVTAFSIGNEPNLYTRRNNFYHPPNTRSGNQQNPNSSNPPNASSDNRPNVHSIDTDAVIHDATSDFDQWKKFASVIEAAAPGVPLGAPDTDHEPSGRTFFAYFVQHQVEVGQVRYLFSHDYEGRGGDRSAGAQQKIIDLELSPTLDTVNNPEDYQKVGVPAASVHLPYRFTEFNNYVAPMPGTMGGNNGFAGALFAVDAMHWWASHDCAGVNFHTVIGKYNGTVYRDANGDFQVYPVGYGILAFGVGGNGTEHAVTITNSQNLALTAYAVKDEKGSYFVTVVNMEHGAAARNAEVEVQLPLEMKTAKARMMTLQAPNNDATAVSGITLGGASISNHAPWIGKWTPVRMDKKGLWTVIVPATSAAIVRFDAR
jgi:hypothetical protein